MLLVMASYRSRWKQTKTWANTSVCCCLVPVPSVPSSECERIRQTNTGEEFQPLVRERMGFYPGIRSEVGAKAEWSVGMPPLQALRFIIYSWSTISLCLMEGQCGLNIFMGIREPMSVLPTSVEICVTESLLVSSRPSLTNLFMVQSLEV